MNQLKQIMKLILNFCLIIIIIDSIIKLDLIHCSRWYEEFEQNFHSQIAKFNNRLRNLTIDQQLNSTEITVQCRTALEAYFDNPFQNKWSLQS